MRISVAIFLRSSRSKRKMHTTNHFGCTGRVRKSDGSRFLESSLRQTAMKLLGRVFRGRPFPTRIVSSLSLSLLTLTSLICALIYCVLLNADAPIITFPPRPAAPNKDASLTFSPPPPHEHGSYKYVQTPLPLLFPVWRSVAERAAKLSASCPEFIFFSVSVHSSRAEAHH